MELYFNSFNYDLEMEIEAVTTHEHKELKESLIMQDMSSPYFKKGSRTIVATLEPDEY